MFTKNDIKQFESKGIPLWLIEQQIENFNQGFPFAELVKPAIPGDGIKQFNEREIDGLISFYDEHIKHKTVLKFVPASGAASRMFKNLFNYLDEIKEKDQEEIFTADKGFNSVYNYITNIKKFAFYSDLTKKLQELNLDAGSLLIEKKYSPLVEYLFEDKGLGYGNLPKGLLKFHKYNDHDRVAMEEHLVEAGKYALDGNKIARVHFTVSPEHMEKFKKTLDSVRKNYEVKLNIAFEVGFSVQKSSTDTLAVDMNNNPFREPDDSIVFRPAGHGALIENLNDLEQDIIFVKNIDNVVPDRLKSETIRFKKVTGGLLIKLQNECFDILKAIDHRNLSSEDISRITEFAEKNLNITIPESFMDFSLDQKISFLKKHLDRPIRICGMVKNEGEPGGGPFWVRNSQGEVSLQIVESSQIDMDNPKQVENLNAATHFNPVDLVCGIKNFKGEKFDLHKFVDPETGFISVKSKGGKNLKAQELPGLWNGAMANWNTVFVEVPLITFNPVKTVNDLLRDQHQPG
ncbi:MAG: DUF4301 family protein [Bacteroidales bacterium]